MPLSPAAMIVLTRAADHPGCFLEFNRKLPAGARCKMIDAMLRDGLVAETEGDYRRAAMVEDAETGMLLTALGMIAAGFTSIGQEPPTMTEADIEEELDLQQQEIDRENSPDEAARAAQAGAGGPEGLLGGEAPESPRVPLSSAGLRHAALAVLAAWDAEENRSAGLERPLGDPRRLQASPCCHAP